MPHTFSFFLPSLFRSFLPAHPPPPTSLHLSLSSFLHAFQDNLLCKKKNYQLTHKPVAPIWPRNRIQWKTTVSATSQVFVHYLGSGANKWPNVLVAEGKLFLLGHYSQLKEVLLRLPTKVPMATAHQGYRTCPAGTNRRMATSWALTDTISWYQAHSSLPFPPFYLTNVTIIWPRVSLHVENLF